MQVSASEYRDNHQSVHVIAFYLLPFRIMMTFAKRMLKDLGVGAKGASLRFCAILSLSCALPAYMLCRNIYILPCII
jgi:hypothetical protein